MSEVKTKEGSGEGMNKGRPSYLLGDVEKMFLLGKNQVSNRR